MKTSLSFRRSFLFPLFVLTFLMSGCVSYVNKQDEISQTIEFGPQGIIPNKEYVVNFPDSQILSLNENYLSLFLLLRYTNQVRLKDLTLQTEFASLCYDSIWESSINVSLFDDINSQYRSGHLGIFQKEIPISNNLPIGEGFFFSFKTPQENTFGFIDATVFLRKEQFKTNVSYKQ